MNKGWHRHTAPNAAPTGTNFLNEIIQRFWIIFITLGNSRKSWPYRLSIYLVTSSTGVSLNQFFTYNGRTHLLMPQRSAASFTRGEPKLHQDILQIRIR